MRKRFFSIFLLFLLVLSLVSATTIDTSGLEDSVSGVKDQAKDIKDKTDELKEFTEEDKWEYLGERWKESLLKNRFVAGMDSSLEKISLVFVVLMGQEYELSFTFFFSVVFWIFFFIVLNQSFRDMLPFKKGSSTLIAFGTVVALGHMGFLELISGWLLKLLFFKEGIWGWALFVIFLITYFGVLVYLKKILRAIGKSVKRKKDLKEKKGMKQQQQENTAYIKGMRKTSEAA
tara:strand:+ start:3620 stop:4315 length:696 start_codon:yes stop_codon:yes gene_type:complete